MRHPFDPESSRRAASAPQCPQYIPLATHPLNPKPCVNCFETPDRHSLAARQPKVTARSPLLSLAVAELEAKASKLDAAEENLRQIQTQLAERMDACKRYEAEVRKLQGRTGPSYDSLESRNRQLAEELSRSKADEKAYAKIATASTDRANRLADRVKDAHTVLVMVRDMLKQALAGRWIPQSMWKTVVSEINLALEPAHSFRPKDSELPQATKEKLLAIRRVQAAWPRLTFAGAKAHLDRFGSEARIVNPTTRVRKTA